MKCLFLQLLSFIYGPTSSPLDPAIVEIRRHTTHERKKEVLALLEKHIPESTLIKNNFSFRARL
jgi:hypothetical protein